MTSENDSTNMTEKQFIESGPAMVRLVPGANPLFMPKKPGDNNAPLCTKDAYANGLPSFAHVFASGHAGGDGVMRHHQQLCTIADLEYIEPTEYPEVSPDALANVLTGDWGW